MDVILNIGLAREGSNIGSGTVIREVIASFGAASFTFARSDTKITCVACVDDGGVQAATLAAKVDHLSRLLGQDCIAVYYPDYTYGALVGPRAAEWGAFNPALFLMPATAPACRTTT